jgi:alpha-mannosidase
MHDDHLLVQKRLRRMTERVERAVYGSAVPLDVELWRVTGEPVAPGTGLAASYSPTQVGVAWGPAWGTSWFHFTGQVPTAWAGRAVEAVIDLGFDVMRTGFHAEGLVYRPDGEPVKGLNPRSQWVRIGDPVRGGEAVELYVEAASNPMILGVDGYDFEPTTLGDPATAGHDPLYCLERAELALFNRQVWELARDLEVLGQLMLELPLDGGRRWDLVRHLDRALDAIALDDVAGSAPAARALLAPALAAPAAASAHRLSAIGHAHIDSAWLWPVRETVRKVARTVANVTELMEHEPDLIFAMSSAQHFDWIKAHSPQVYAKVRRRVAEGRFVPVGGMWVESDTNMPGGEALARQFVYGKQFFLDEFGIDTQEVWLPDSFGYSAALPQLVKLSGSRWFLTQKISWNQSNTFPHHSFLWEGLDGTRAFTHFPPVDTYNSEISGAELAHAARNYAEKGRANRSMVPFGHGDGGGGPTREMLARARRTRDLEGSPRVEIERPAEFFTAAEAEYTDAPVWVGELYLESHRGTYTSQAKTKQGNRRSEGLLREAELWAATATITRGTPYPYDELARNWKTVLLQQFHDILPGSSIAWVHHQVEENYAVVAAELNALIATATGALVTQDATAVTAFNAAPHSRGSVAALGAGPVPQPAGPVALTGSPASGWVLDNGVLRVALSGRGLLTSVADLCSGRECLAPGEVGNLLQLHQDLPNEYDAWDVDAFYRNTVTDLVDVESAEAATTETGAATVTVTRVFSASTLRQVTSLEPGAGRVDFETVIDWHESEKLLKVAFPLDVRADRSAAETQFGHVFRATHRNTSWDAAKFEICAHRFLHVAETGYGVALVNDSTYGHDVTRDVRADGGTTTTVRLSLLRAPRCPDPYADQGEHRLRYALVPGAEIVDAVREGYALSLPERRVRGRGSLPPLVSVPDASVVIEAVKLAEDRSGDLVVRLYEAAGGRTRTRLSTSFAACDVHETDLLERRLPDAAALTLDADAGVQLELRPFQIRTLRLRPV